MANSSYIYKCIKTSLKLSWKLVKAGEKRLEKELQEKSEFQDLLEQVKPWRFVGEDLFQKAKDYIDVQTQGIRSLALAYSKGLIIENSSKYKLIYKESKFTCGYPLKTFDDDESTNTFEELQ